MKIILLLLFCVLSILGNAQPVISFSLELSDGTNKDTVTVGYDPSATNLIDPQLGEIDISTTPRKVIDIRSIAMPMNCILDSINNGFSGFYETKIDFKPGFLGLPQRPRTGQRNYGMNVQSFDSSTFYFSCKLTNMPCTLSFINNVNSGSLSGLQLISYSNILFCSRIRSRNIPANLPSGFQLFIFNNNPSFIDSIVYISLTAYNETTSLPKTLAAAQLQLRQNVLTATTAFKPERVEAVDYLGRVQHQGEWAKDQASYELPLQSGIWFLRLYYNGQPTVLRVRVEG